MNTTEDSVVNLTTRLNVTLSPTLNVTNSGNESSTPLVSSSVPINDATLNQLSAWLGLTILFGAMVFVLVFVALYDRMIRKNFVTLLDNDENGDSKSSLESGMTSHKDVSNGDGGQEEDVSSKKTKRKRQQKADLAQKEQIELKRL